MAHYLVTGGCGFIGAHLVHRLVTDGHRVTVLDDLSTGRREAIPAAATFIAGSILDQALLESIIHDSIDGCFHLAAIASVERCRTEWRTASEVNVMGSIAVLEAMRCLHKKVPLVYASSAAVYGAAEHSPITETDALQPINSYGVDKLSVEHYARVVASNDELPAVGLRFFNVYGEGQSPDSPYSGVISRFIHALSHRQAVTIFGDGEQTRDFIYVGDVVRAMIAVMQQAAGGAEIYNICTGRAVSIRELASVLADHLRVIPKIETKPARAGDIRHSCGNPGKLRSVLNLPPAMPLAGGLALMPVFGGKNDRKQEQ